MSSKNKGIIHISFKTFNISDVPIIATKRLLFK